MISQPLRINHTTYDTTTSESTPSGPDWTQSITNCETLVTTIKPSTPPDQTNSITTPQSKGTGVPIVIAVIVVLVILLIGLISASGVLVLLMVYRRSRNSTTQNTSTIIMTELVLSVDVNKIRMNSAKRVTTAIIPHIIRF